MLTIEMLYLFLKSDWHIVKKVTISMYVIISSKGLLDTHYQIWNIKIVTLKLPGLSVSLFYWVLLPQSLMSVQVIISEEMLEQLFVDITLWINLLNQPIKDTNDITSDVKFALTSLPVCVSHSPPLSLSLSLSLFLSLYWLRYALDFSPFSFIGHI